MLAFAHAVEAGATHVESDVHGTADGIAVLVHDPTLDRVAGRDIVVGDTLMRDLRGVELGQAQHVPQLREALLAFPDTRFNLDLKSDAAVVPAVRAIVEAKAEDRVLVTSFVERRRRAAARLLPGVASSASRRIIAQALAACSTGMRRSFARVLSPVVAVQVPRRQGSVRVVTPRFVDWCEHAGVEVHVWTVNDVDEMRELLAMGVHGIVTDRADLALGLLPR